MSKNGQTISRETWDSHNAMMLEPLATNDSEVRMHLCHSRPGGNVEVLVDCVGRIVSGHCLEMNPEIICNASL
jgi:hypothetical protein